MSQNGAAHRHALPLKDAANPTAGLKGGDVPDAGLKSSDHCASTQLVPPRMDKQDESRKSTVTDRFVPLN